jgi:hypothetical protein
MNLHNINIDPIQKEPIELRDVEKCTLRDKRIGKEKKYGQIIKQAYI